MQVINSVYPNEAQLAGFAEPGPEGPIYMVNLLKFRERAEYPDGRSTELSGREAYGLYAEGVSELIKEFGGGIVFAADVVRLMLGEAEELEAAEEAAAETAIKRFDGYELKGRNIGVKEAKERQPRSQNFSDVRPFGMPRSQRGSKPKGSRRNLSGTQSQETRTTDSTCLNSGSPVTMAASSSWASATAKASA